MKDPKDILGVDPHGAHMSPVDSRDYKYEEIAHASIPFDWAGGYDFETELAAILNKPFSVPIKNQGASGSCGGQAEGYLGASIAAYNDKVYEEKSAKFTYAPVAVVPGGGSSGRDLANRSINTGWGSETLTTSYQNGQPPSESFMEQVSDITPAATQHASSSKALSYVLLPIDIDSVAQAVRDYKGVRIGVVGSNNGTWLTNSPIPPKDGEVFWYHWITFHKAKMLNGKKALGFYNSWGTAAGDQGLQWLTQDWFANQLTTYPGGIPLFEPRCYVWNNQPAPTTFHHDFTIDMGLGYQGQEAVNLQTALLLDGEFPSSVPTSPIFGPATLAAVRKFQVKYSIASAGQTGYGRCGPATRAKLNSLFNQ